MAEVKVSRTDSGPVSRFRLHSTQVEITPPGAGTEAPEAPRAAAGVRKNLAEKGAKSARTASAQRTVAKSAAKGPERMELFKQGVGELASGALKAAKVSALISAVWSLATSAYGLVSGQEGVGEALGSVLSDAAGGFLGGAAGALASGGALAIAEALGLTAGLPYVLLGFTASTAAFLVMDFLFQAAIGDGFARYVHERIDG